MDWKCSYGWNSTRGDLFQPFQERGFVPARVIEEAQGLYRIATERGLILAELAGAYRFSANARDEMPAVGDWVATHPVQHSGDKAIIHAVMPRQSCFRRKIAGLEIDAQIVASNIDMVMLVNPIDSVNVRRIERFLTAAWSSGATPVIVMTKADLAVDIDAILAQIEPIALGSPVFPVSAQTGFGMDKLYAYLAPQTTTALVGLSGAGKSTLLNAWMTAASQRTQDVRSADGRGRHTTTQRTLFQLPNGAMIIDTPGMRELQLWDDDGMDDTFPDILALASGCAFRDCHHTAEPGCAVQMAIQNGDLPAERYANYQKMNRELAHLARKQEQALRSQTRETRKRAKRSHRV